MEGSIDLSQTMSACNDEVPNISSQLANYRRSKIRSKNQNQNLIMMALKALWYC